MKKIWSFLKSNIQNIGALFFLTFLIFLVFWTKESSPSIIKNNVIYEEFFDVDKVPAGLIIWKHGVPGTENNFIFADSIDRYEKYHIGILNIEGTKVYKVEIPFYVNALFPLGGFVNKDKMFKKPLYPNKNI